jgi:hypothetical protein
MYRVAHKPSHRAHDSPASDQGWVGEHRVY